MSKEGKNRFKVLQKKEVQSQRRRLLPIIIAALVLTGFLGGMLGFALAGKSASGGEPEEESYEPKAIENFPLEGTYTGFLQQGGEKKILMLKVKEVRRLGDKVVFWGKVRLANYDFVPVRGEIQEGQVSFAPFMIGRIQFDLGDARLIEDGFESNSLQWRLTK